MFLIRQPLLNAEAAQIHHIAISLAISEEEDGDDDETEEEDVPLKQ